MRRVKISRNDGGESVMLICDPNVSVKDEIAKWEGSVDWKAVSWELLS